MNRRDLLKTAAAVIVGLPVNTVAGNASPAKLTDLCIKGFGKPLPLPSQLIPEYSVWLIVSKHNKETT